MPVRAAIRLASNSRSMSICSRSHSRTSSDTCSLRLRPVWILSASAAHSLLQLADDQGVDVFVGGAVEELRIARFVADLFEGARPVSRAPSAVRMPARSSARAKACEPRLSASINRRSKCSEPENRSKTSEGRLESGRPIVSFASARLPRPARAPGSAARSG